MSSDNVRVEVSIGGQNYSLTVRESVASLVQQAAEAVDSATNEKLRNPLLSTKEKALAVVALENAMRYLKHESLVREQEQLAACVRSLNQMIEVSLGT